MTPDLLWFIHLGLARRLFTLGDAQRALERLPAGSALLRYARHLIDDGHITDPASVPSLIEQAEAKSAEGGDYGTLAAIIETLSRPSQSRAPFVPDPNPVNAAVAPPGLDDPDALRRELAARQAELDEIRQTLQSREIYLEQCEIRLLDRAASLQELETYLEQREENVRRAEHLLRQSASPFASAILATLPPLAVKPLDEFVE